MMLCIRTDDPHAQLFLYDKSGQQIGSIKKELGRTMATHILGCIEDLLQQQDMEWNAVTGIVVYQGPGSFTGLRIGVTIANTIAYSLQIPVLGTAGDAWIQDGLQRLLQGDNDKTALPYYNKEANITTPRK